MRATPLRGSPGVRATTRDDTEVYAVIVSLYGPVLAHPPGVREDGLRGREHVSTRFPLV